MSTVVWVLLVIILVVGFLLVKYRSKMSPLISKVFPAQSVDKVVDQLQKETNLEEKRTEELRKVLSAKQDLVRARLKKTTLQHEIDNVTETTIARMDKEKTARK